MRGGRKNLEALLQELIGSAWIWIGLVVVIGIGVWVVSRIRSRFADDEGSATEDHGLLSQIADLKEQGDLTEEEYRSIKGRLIERLDDSTSVYGERRTAQQDSPASPGPIEKSGGDSTTRGASDD